MKHNNKKFYMQASKCLLKMPYYSAMCFGAMLFAHGSFAWFIILQQSVSQKTKLFDSADN